MIRVRLALRRSVVEIEQRAPPALEWHSAPTLERFVELERHVGHHRLDPVREIAQSIEH